MLLFKVIPLRNKVLELKSIFFCVGNFLLLLLNTYKYSKQNKKSPSENSLTLSTSKGVLGNGFLF